LEYSAASAREIARAIGAKQVSSREAVAACIARIERVNPLLNAVVATRFEAALVDADAADAAVARGASLGPLHGVPITIKDSFDTADLVTTWGTPGRKSFVPHADASAVARLRAAGAILLGKTNTPEFTLGFESVNPVYGRTNNPYDLSRTPGGSSGGAAAIVAAGGVPLDLGSDTGGSIRLPAHFCGIAGIRPTAGCVSRAGHAIAPGTATDWLTTIGPLARHVEDLALALSLIAGPDGVDPFLAPVPLRDPGAVSLDGLRVAVFSDNGITRADPAVADAVHAAARVLAEHGARVVEFRPPTVARTEPLFMQVILIDGGPGIRLLLEGAGTRLEDTSLAGFAAAPAPSPEARVRIVGDWDRFRVDLLAETRDVDLLVCPPNAHTALRHGEVDAMMRAFSHTMTWNLAGWPGAVVRAGTSPEGLPIGVQLVAKPWREDVALAAALRIETALGGWRPAESLRRNPPTR
jgi:amidase